MGNVIPFPRQPRSGSPAATGIVQAFRADGMPIRPGDAVRVKTHGGLGGETDGIVSGLGIAFTTTGQQTYSVIGFDGVCRLAIAENITSLDRINGDGGPCAA